MMAKEHTYKALAAEVRSSRAKRKPVDDANEGETGKEVGQEGDPSPAPKSGAKAKAKGNAKAKSQSKRQRGNGD